MNTDIRENIINNFKNSNKEDIKDSINEAIKEKEEVTLPGMGVFFEILWENSNESDREFIINTITKELSN